jgi:transposase-like protein
VRGYDHAPERRWRHLNVCQLQSEIVCALPRGECQSCRKVYTVRPPWEGRSRGLTQEFEAFALTLMREMPVQKAEEILGGNGSEIMAGALRPCGRGVAGFELGECGLGGGR